MLKNTTKPVVTAKTTYTTPVASQYNEKRCVDWERHVTFCNELHLVKPMEFLRYSWRD